MKPQSPAPLLSVCALAGLSLAPGAQGWPQIFDPLELRVLELELSQSDWETISADETFDIEVPAAFGMAGETKILVSVRRKSATPIGDKISLKIDINQYYPGQEWHDLKKLSLENGDDENVIKEGFAWYLHRLVANASSSGYMPGLASWVKLYVNEQYLGVYVNVEQPDKTFLRNRGVYVEDQTWLYKVSDLCGLELEVGAPDSPTSEVLCFEPFRCGADACPQPGDFDAVVQAHIDLDALLTLGAAGAFHTGPDQLFTKGKNFFFADFGSAKRQYVPWDLDSVFNGLNESIYPSSTGDYAPLLRQYSSRFEQIMAEMLDTAFLETDLITFLDALETVLDGPVTADPNNNLDGTVAEEFDGLRSWIHSRIAMVGAEIGWGGPPSCGAAPYGQGLGGANVATLATQGLPRPGSRMVLEISGPLDSTSARYLLGSHPLSRPLLGGTLLVDPSFSSGAVRGTVSIPLTGGAGSFTVRIPSDPAIVGSRFYVQALMRSPSTQPSGWALTNGLRLIVCP